MTAPAIWNVDAEVCNVLSASQECLPVSEFEARFRRVGPYSLGWWTVDGAPQIWVPQVPKEAGPRFV